MITLQQLTYFRELVRTGHMTRTAEKLYITQATLSNVISNLEKQLGVKLFDRVGRTLQLSAAGELYYPCVVQALDALESGQAQLGSLLHTGEDKVTFAANNSIVWAELIRDFQSIDGYGPVRHVNCTDPQQTRRMLVDMEVDFAIAGVTDFPLDGLQWQVFREDEIFVCLPLNHPLAERKQVYLRDLEGEKVINLPQGHPFQAYCDRLLAQAGVTCQVVMEIDYRMSTPLIESGAGIALVTGSSYRFSASYLGGKTVCIPIVDAVPLRAIALVWNPNRHLGRTARAFRDFIPRWEQEKNKA